jgi:hypothetical protein
MIDYFSYNLLGGVVEGFKKRECETDHERELLSKLFETVIFENARHGLDVMPPGMAVSNAARFVQDILKEAGYDSHVTIEAQRVPGSNIITAERPWIQLRR